MSEGLAEAGDDFCACFRAGELTMDEVIGARSAHRQSQGGEFH
jgi:hypothetical protein